MSERQRRLFLYQKNAEIAINALKDKGHTYLNSQNFYEILVYQTGHDEVPTDLIHEMLSSEEMVELFEEFRRQNGEVIGEIRFDIGEEIIDAEGTLEKATIKMDGNVWRIHKNDADPFPSEPHAHLVGSPLKLHLGNGILFKKTKYYDKIPSKKLLQLREMITQRISITLPPLEV